MLSVLSFYGQETKDSMKENKMDNLSILPYTMHYNWNLQGFIKFPQPSCDILSLLLPLFLQFQYYS